MLNRQPTLQPQRRAIVARRRAARFLFSFSLLFFLPAAVNASSLSEYHEHIRKAVTYLNTLAQSEKNESAGAYAMRDVQTVQLVRNLVPKTETVEMDGATFSVDNSWLHEELDQYAAQTSEERYDLLQTITERLEAIDDRIEELKKAPAVGGASKADESRKLEEILRRAEYAHKAQQQNALARMIDSLIKWLQSWFPKPKPVAPGSVNILSQIAQWLVIVLALGVLAFVLKLLWPRFFNRERPKKKRKEKARIVLGETLGPDQSALDLLAEAEALARRGELRAAIRRAYIALLVELGDRKILSLAQYKTNRDYLRAMREIEPLYRNVKQLTDSFERHWYGLAHANENDWQAFRSAYNQALMK
jgi:hypothetical protein